MSPDIPRHDNASRQASAREFIAVVFRRKWIILGLFVVTTATVLTIAFTTPVTYTSLGKVQISRGEQTSILNPYRAMTAWEEELATEVQVVRGVPVSLRAQKVLDERASAGAAKLALDPSRVDAKVEGTSTVLAIDYVDGDGLVAQQVCDAVITAYVEHRQASDISYPKEFFETEIKKVQGELERLEQRRRAFFSSSGTADLGQQRQSSIAYLSSMRQQRNEIAADLAEAESGMSHMDAFKTDPSMDIPILGRDYESVLVDLKVKILQHESRLAQLRERFREDAPEVVNAQATLETMRGILRREVESRLKMARARVEILQSRLVPIDREIARAEAELATMPAKDATLRELDLEIAMLRTRYEELNAKSDQARITERTTSGTRVDVLQPAGPGVASNPRDYGRLLLAPAFSLIVGLGLAFFVDGLDSRVRNPRDAEAALQLPVLASVTERTRAR